MDRQAIKNLASLALAIDLIGSTFMVRRVIQRLDRKEISVAEAVRMLDASRPMYNEVTQIR